MKVWVNVALNVRTVGKLNERQEGRERERSKGNAEVRNGGDMSLFTASKKGADLANGREERRHKVSFFWRAKGHCTQTTVPSGTVVSKSILLCKLCKFLHGENVLYISLTRTKIFRNICTMSLSSLILLDSLVIQLLYKKIEQMTLVATYPFCVCCWCVGEKDKDDRMIGSLLVEIYWQTWL